MQERITELVNEEITVLISYNNDICKVLLMTCH